MKYLDVNGVEIKVGDTVLDLCDPRLLDGETKPDKHLVESLEQLDDFYISSWGMLEVDKG